MPENGNGWGDRGLSDRDLIELMGGYEGPGIGADIGGGYGIGESSPVGAGGGYGVGGWEAPSGGSIVGPAGPAAGVGPLNAALLESMGLSQQMGIGGQEAVERPRPPSETQQRPREEEIARAGPLVPAPTGGPQPPRSPLRRIADESGYGNEWDWVRGVLPPGRDPNLAYASGGPGAPAGGSPSIIERLMENYSEDLRRLRAPVGMLPDEATAREQALERARRLGAPVDLLPGEAAAREQALARARRLGIPVDLLPDEATAREQALRHRGYLEADPFTTTEEQAIVERAKGRIRNNFATQRQRAIDEAGAYNRPLAPMLDVLAQQEQQALNEVDRELLARTSAERRSRMAEARGVMGELGRAERGREMEGLRRAGEAGGIMERLGVAERGREMEGLRRTGEAGGIMERLGAAERGREELGFRRGAESRQVLTALEALERARQAEALGIEVALDDRERRAILDVLGLIQGLAPQAGEMASISGNLLNYAGRLGERAQQQADQQAQGFGDIFSMWRMMQPGGGGGGGRVPGFTGAPSPYATYPYTP